MIGPLEVVRALNDSLARLSRRATAKHVTAEDERELARAMDLLQQVARFYVDAPLDRRQRIRAAAGRYPEIDESLIETARRVVSFWPRRKGDYEAALWMVALGLAGRLADTGLTSDSLRVALAALSVEGARYDSRDTMVYLEKLKVAARAAGLDPVPVLAEAAARERAGAKDEESLMASLLDAAARDGSP